MKLAVDVKGTLEGHKKQQVLKIIDILSKLGYEVTVWSNLYSYAVDAVRDNKLNAQVSSKMTPGDLDFDESRYFNIAIEDDRQQSYLPAKKFIWVDEIPNDIDKVEMFIKEEILGDQ